MHTLFSRPWFPAPSDPADVARPNESRNVQHRTFNIERRRNEAALHRGVRRPVSGDRRARFLVLAALAAGGLRAAEPVGANVTGADVPEDRIAAILYVDVGHPKASDENPGTEQLPLKSIGRGAELAVANNAKGVGTKLLIAPGVYRDAVRLPNRGKAQTDAPIVFEATRKGEVVLSGSDVFDDWQRVEGAENLYWHRWPYKWGPREQVKDPVWIRCGIFYRPILLRKETVYCNGQLLKLALSPLELREGMNYVSEEEEKLIVWLPRGLDARTALMEVPVRAGLFVASGQRNIVLRGLVLRHDNHYYGMASACSFGSGSQNFLIEDCRFEWNNCGGIGLNTCRDLTLRRVVSNHNGGAGVLGCRLHNVLFEDTENSYNNWRGDWGEYYSWSVGATKFLVTHDAVFRRNRSIGNYALGFWFDMDCTGILVDGCWWVRNLRAGIFIEANQGPIVIRNGVMAFNEHGVTSTNSSHVTLENNVLYGNTSSQIGVMGPRDRAIKTWEWGGKSTELTLQIRDWTLRRNVVVSTNARQPCLNVSYQDTELFLSTLSSDGNVWFGLDAPRVFSLAGVLMNLDEWRTATGNDVGSQFTDPGFVDPGSLNFWSSSVARFRGAPTPAAAPAFDAERAGALLREKQKELIARNWGQPFGDAVEVEPGRWLPVGLGPYLNRPMRGKDGWMGVGGLTLDWLEGGRQVIQGVPFEVADPVGGKTACIALRSFKVKTTGDRELPSCVTVDLGRKIRALYVLHGCGWGAHKKAGQYRMLYEDGTRATIDILPYGSGSEHLDVVERMRRESTIQDWWPSLTQIENERLRHVIVANPENLADKRYLYNLRWRNPSPGKNVKAIELESEPTLSASLFVVAITAVLAE